MKISNQKWYFSDENAKILEKLALLDNEIVSLKKGIVLIYFLT